MVALLMLSAAKKLKGQGDTGDFLNALRAIWALAVHGRVKFCRAAAQACRTVLLCLFVGPLTVVQLFTSALE